MACLSEHHKTMTNGIGKCSVPMWMNGCPAGFCDADAYGKQQPNQHRYGEYVRGKWWPGYCSGLACYAHGGPAEKYKGIDLGNGTYSGCDHSGGDCPSCGC